MNHKADIRLVKSHSKSDCCHQNLDLVFHKEADNGFLALFPILLHIRIITSAGNAVFLKPFMYHLAVADCQTVDQSGARQFSHVVCQPGQAFLLCLQLYGLYLQRLPHQASPADFNVLAQLAFDVLNDPVVSCGRGGQNGNVGRQHSDDINNTPVGLFRQALILASVACFHMENRNMKSFRSNNR